MEIDCGMSGSIIVRLAKKLSSAAGDAMQGWESVFGELNRGVSKRESRLLFVLESLVAERRADNSLIARILQWGWALI